MDLTPFVEDLRRELAVAADAGGDDARALAERLTAPLESAVRLMLLEALSAAADEITRELAPGSVELRLRTGDPEFVITTPPQDDGPEPAPAPLALPEADDAATARVNLRLPESLKAGIEAAAGRERLSVNAWLVRAAATALAGDASPPRPRGGRLGRPTPAGCADRPGSPPTTTPRPLRHLTRRRRPRAELQHPRTDHRDHRRGRRRGAHQRRRARRHRRRGAPQRRVARGRRGGGPPDTRRVRRRAPAGQVAEVPHLAHGDTRPSVDVTVELPPARGSMARARRRTSAARDGSATAGSRPPSARSSSTPPTR
jgi:hypothetical protein